jgi:hypothetical protein
MVDPPNEVATIYCDESGNTGPNLLDKAAPFFVYAWVLLTKEQEDIIASQISDLLKKEKLPLSTELSSVKLLRSTRGCRRYDEVLRIAHNAGGNFFVTYSEKLFEVCVLIVETYLDPFHNPRVGEHLLDIEFRRLLGNAIRDSVSEDLLRLFLNACNTDDVDALRSVGSTLARQLALHPDDRVSHAAQVMAAGLGDFYRFGQRIQDAPKNINLRSSHVTVFTPALLFIDSTLDSFRLRARLVRDQDIQFGGVLDFAYEFLSQPPLQLKNIISSEEGISSQSIGLQVADLAAGITARVLNARYNRRSLKPNHWSIWKSLRGSLLWGNWSYQLTSDDCEARLSSLWEFTDGAWYERGLAKEKNKVNPMRCSTCGQIISGGRICDFYQHVLEYHPDGQLIGFPCDICGELIPFGLGACHKVRDHGIEPPLRGDFYGDMRNAYEVFKKIRERGMKIVVPKNRPADMDIDRAD